jgi:hypothetical protein
MNRRASLLLGVTLIALGLLAMAVTVGLPALGLNIWNVFSLRRYWPLTVIGVGAGFVLPPFLYRHRRGLGGLFIPGLPILATGCILLFASVLNWWSVWSWLWPLEVLSVAAGFVLAAIHLRVIWLIIPATIIGANGVLFQFCAITGLWDVWAVMWTIEPLSVGLSLLLIGALKRRSGLMTAGLLLCGIGGVGLVGMSAILSVSWFASWLWVFRFTVPAALVLGGVALLLWGLSRSAASFKVR